MLKSHQAFNYLDKYLEIKVLGEETVINYFCDDTLVYAHRHKIGLQKIDIESVSKFIISDWVNGVIFILSHISLYDRVPKHIYLYTEKYPYTFEQAIRDQNTYAQFYLGEDLEDKHLHVIINKINVNNLNSDLNLKIFSKSKNKKSYERYTKAISQFKY